MRGVIGSRELALIRLFPFAWPSSRSELWKAIYYILLMKLFDVVFMGFDMMFGEASLS